MDDVSNFTELNIYSRSFSYFYIFEKLTIVYMLGKFSSNFSYNPILQNSLSKNVYKNLEAG